VAIIQEIFLTPKNAATIRILVGKFLNVSRIMVEKPV
jgi:hypothetical protein